MAINFSAYLNISNFKESANKVIKKVSEVSSKVKDMNKETDKAGSGLKEMFKQAAAFTGVTSALALVASLIKNNIETAKNFEKSISELRSLTGLFGEDLEYLKNKAKELGSTTTQSASQVVEAMKLIGSQKPELLKNKEALAEVTAQAITLAEASGMEVPQAATALTTALNQMGASANSAGEYINIMAAASQQGAGDITYINNALVKSGATAKMAGLGFNELTAAIEAVAKGGYDAASAGTSLRNILLNLEKGTNANFKPSVVGLNKALENLANANLDTKQKVSLFGAENLSVADTLITEREECEKMTKSITGTQTAYEQAKTNTDNFAGSIANLSSAWEGLMLRINESNGSLREFVDMITDLLNGDIWGDNRRFQENFNKYFKSTIDYFASGYYASKDSMKSDLLERIEEPLRHLLANAENKDQEEKVRKLYDQAVKYIDELVNRKFDETTPAPATPAASTGNKETDDEKAKKERERRLKQARSRKDLEKKLAEEQKQYLIDLALETSRAELDAMSEGNDKKRAEIEQEYQESIAEINKWYEEIKKKKAENSRALWEAKNPDSIWNEKYLSTADLAYTEQEMNAYALKMRAAEQQRTNASIEIMQSEQDAMNDFLIRYGNYYDQREAITRKYQQKILQAQSEGDRLMAESEMSEELEQLDQKFEKSGSKIYKLWKNVAKKSRKELQSIIKELKQVQKSMQDGKIDSQERNILKSLGFTDTDIDQLERGTITVQQITDKIDDLQGQLEDASSAAQNFWDALNNEEGAIDFEKVSNSFNDMISQINAYSEGLSKMADILGNQSVKDAMADVQTMVNDIGTGASIGAQYGGYGALIGAAVGAGVGTGEIIKDHINDEQIKMIKMLQQNIDKLERSYSKLGITVQETYSKEKQSNIELQIENINRQNNIIRKQIESEREKKDSNEDTIYSYQLAIQDNIDKIEELRKQAKDAIFGEDLQNAINNFASAYAEAWSNNENRTRKAKDVVRDIMKQMVTESIKSTIEASGAMEKIREKLTEYFNDGVLTEAEQQAIYSEAEKIQQKLDKQFSWADDLYDNNKNFISSTSGGFQTMSQESADELNGRFTTAQITIESILQQTMLIYASNQQVVTVTTDSNDVLKEIRNLMITMGSNVEDIASYTKSLTTFGEKFDQMNRQLAKL